MALSQVIFKTLQLLTLAGGVSMSPQGVKHVKKWINDTFYAPPSSSLESSSSSSTAVDQPSTNQALSTQEAQTTVTPTSAVPPPVPTPQPPAPAIIKVLASQGYVGCETLARQKGRKHLLYVCWKRDETGTNKPSFFYYDREGFRNKNNAQANQITNMIKSSSAGKVTLKFKEGNPQELEYPSPFWMSHFQDRGLNPDEHCELKSEENKSPYTLFCKKDGRQDQMIQKGIHI